MLLGIIKKRYREAEKRVRVDARSDCIDVVSALGGLQATIANGISGSLTPIQVLSAAENSKA
jgi:hypothetical protein